MHGTAMQLVDGHSIGFHICTVWIYNIVECPSTRYYIPFQKVCNDTYSMCHSVMMKAVSCCCSTLADLPL